MAVRGITFLETTGDGVVQETNTTTDEFAIGRITLNGINGNGLDAQGNTILNVPTPVNATDCANKAYVDAGAAAPILVAINIGTLPVAEATVLVNDSRMTTSSVIAAALCGSAPNKDNDEVGMDSFALACTPLAGQVSIYIRGLEGYISDSFYVSYTKVA